MKTTTNDVTLISIVLQLVLTLSVLVFKALRMTVRIFIKCAKWLFARKSADVQTSTTAVSPSDQQSSSTIQAKVLASVSRDYTDYEASIPRVVQFPSIGHLTLWAFKGKGVIRRQLVVHNAELVQLLGMHRIPMDDMAWNVADSLDLMEDRAIEDTKALLCDRLRVKSVPAPARLDTTPVPMVAAAEVVDTTVPASSAVTSAAAPVAKTASSAAARNAAQRKPYVHVPSKVEETHWGLLEYAGIVDRSFRGVPSQAYAVDLLNEDVGQIRIHGVDLERALEISGAKVGDLIRVDCTGESPVALSGGKRGTKKHYVVRVL